MAVGRGSPSARPPSLAEPRAVSPLDAKAATDSIKRRYEEMVAGAKMSRAQKFIDAGNDALAKDDIVAAASQYRFAIKYTDDPDVGAKYRELNGKARTMMAEAYTKQARYEESQEKWREAAMSYAKAIEGRPDDADLHERAAHSLRLEGRDLHAAVRFAEAAVQKNPTKTAFRVTLAQVYVDAGLLLRAKSELEHAVKQSPDDAAAKSHLARVKKIIS